MHLLRIYVNFTAIFLLQNGKRKIYSSWEPWLMQRRRLLLEGENLECRRIWLVLNQKKKKLFSTESQKDISIPAHLHELSILEEFACGCGASKENSCFCLRYAVFLEMHLATPVDTCVYLVRAGNVSLSLTSSKQRFKQYTPKRISIIWILLMIKKLNENDVWFARCVIISWLNTRV